MNRKIAITFVVASIAAASAFAETPMADAYPFKASLTREQVRAVLEQHRRSGVDSYADGYNQLTGFQSTRTRAEVKSEFIASRAQVSALNGEDGGSNSFVRPAPQRVVGPDMASLPHAAE